MVDFGIAKWHHHKSLEFDDMDFCFNIYNYYFNFTFI